MKRRGFLKSLLGVAALAAHAKFGSLVPIAEPEVEETKFQELLAPGISPLFNVGNSVMIDAEVMEITQVVYGGHFPKLTVRRGLNHMRMFGVEAK